MRSFATGLFSGMLVIAFGCSADQPSDDAAASDDAVTATAHQAFAEGDAVVTTANLNLRGGPSTRDAILAVMPKGTRVTVAVYVDPDAGSPDLHAEADDTLDALADDDDALAAEDPVALPVPPIPDLEVPPAEPAVPAAAAPGTQRGGFWWIRFGDRAGWAHGAYLKAAPSTATTTSGGAVASTCMVRAATAARAVAGRASSHRCYHFVKAHLGTALGVGFSGVQAMLGAGYQTNAYDFARWVDADPGGAASRAGFAARSVGLDVLPVGAVLVWRPGQCGYSAKSGHIEVNIGGGRACSDFCGTIKRTCGAPKVIVWDRACR